MKKLILLLTFTIAAVGCTATNGPDSEFANVQVSFATQRPGSPLASVMSLSRFAGDTLVTGSDTLVLESVQVVLREIELKRLEVTDCDAAPDEDACEKFETGPVLVDLPLGSTVQQRFALDIPVGTYTEIEFDIHKPDDDDPADSAFIAANPTFADISIRVTGTYNGQMFLYTSDLNVEQELALVPQLVITETTGSANVTILVDVGTWFRSPAGDLVDPATANKGGVNESLVANNIQNSIEAFEDDDRDGSED